MAERTITIRPAADEDLPAMLAIENACFSDAWAAHHLEEDQRLVAEVDHRVAGFLIFRRIDAEEGEILNLAVHPQYRRAGVASALLRHHLKSKTTWFLEVRESNEAARLLYQGFGFTEVGRRKRYYRHPTETAIVMRLQKVLTLH